jgi:hypothetical protein
MQFFASLPVDIRIVAHMLAMGRILQPHSDANINLPLPLLDKHFNSICETERIVVGEEI